MRRIDEYNEIRPAKGTRGFLLGFDEDRFFRIYAPQSPEGSGRREFEDFALATCDMEITIEDGDAYFYVPKDGRPLLDQSPQTLGLDPNASTTRTKISSETVARLKDRRNALIKIRTHLRGDIYDQVVAKAEGLGMTPAQWMERLAEKALLNLPDDPP